MRALPTADRYLSDFFDDRRRGAHGPRRERIERTECDLRLAIETGETALLDDDGRVLLAAERGFDALGAVARVLPVADLPGALAAFVLDPLFRPLSAEEGRERLETCAALLRRLARDPDLTAATRVLRRVDEAIRMETAALAPQRRRAGRRIRR